MRLKEKWSVDSLSNLSILIDYGHTASATFENTGIKFLRITDIQDGFVNWEFVPFCECSAKEQARYKLSNGDIVFARTGATTGKSYIINDCPQNSVFASYLIRVRPNEKIYPKYLFHFFQTTNYWNQISSRSTGTAQAGVNASKLASLQIPLPPLDEQKRIAEVLDKADALREKRRRALQKLDTLLQSVFLEMFGDPVKNPKGWENKKIDDVVLLVSSGSTPLGGSSTYVSEGTIFIRSQNVLMNSLDFSDVAFITDETHNQMKRTWVKNGDVLFNITGASIGRVHYFSGQDDSANVNQHVCIIRPNKQKIFTEFLSYFLSIPSYQSKVLNTNAGATRQAFNFQQIRNFNIFLPSISEQTKFVDIYKKIERLKEKQIKSVNESENLFQSLQQKAFKGELFNSNSEVELNDEKKVWQQTSLF